MTNILPRMDKELEQLPEVIHQAHERIIGGRKLKSKEKILFFPFVPGQKLSPLHLHAIT